MRKDDLFACIVSFSLGYMTVRAGMEYLYMVFMQLY